VRPPAIRLELKQQGGRGGKAAPRTSFLRAKSFPYSHLLHPGRADLPRDVLGLESSLALCFQPETRSEFLRPLHRTAACLILGI
jgi:hypothetical protein